MAAGDHLGSRKRQYQKWEGAAGHIPLSDCFQYMQSMCVCTISINASIYRNNYSRRKKKGKTNYIQRFTVWLVGESFTNCL